MMALLKLETEDEAVIVTDTISVEPLLVAIETTTETGDLVVAGTTLAGVVTVGRVVVGHVVAVTGRVTTIEARATDEVETGSTMTVEEVIVVAAGAVATTGAETTTGVTVTIVVIVEVLDVVVITAAHPGPNLPSNHALPPSLLECCSEVSKLRPCSESGRFGPTQDAMTSYLDVITTHVTSHWNSKYCVLNTIKRLVVLYFCTIFPLIRIRKLPSVILPRESTEHHANVAYTSLPTFYCFDEVFTI